MGIVAIVVTAATLATGVLALIAARGLWRWLVAITLSLNAFALATLVVVALLDHANAARQAGSVRYTRGYERWSGVWQDMAVWSLLDLLACVVWGLSMAVVAVGAMAFAPVRPIAPAPVRPDTPMQGDARVVRLPRRVRWFVLAHAVLTIGQGLATFVWIVPYVPST